jgi:hypothetical protein
VGIRKGFGREKGIEPGDGGGATGSGKRNRNGKERGEKRGRWQEGRMEEGGGATGSGKKKLEREDETGKGRRGKGRGRGRGRGRVLGDGRRGVCKSVTLNLGKSSPQFQLYLTGIKIYKAPIYIYSIGPNSVNSYQS